MVALGGATPGCPRAGIRYSRCPSPTSTWGAATSRHAAAAIILTPSACRRRIAPATSRTPLCKIPPLVSPLLPSLFLTLSHSAAEKKKSEKKKCKRVNSLNDKKKQRNKPARTTTTTTPTLPRNHRPPHQPSSRTTTNHHAPPSRPILVKVNESKVSTY